MPTPDGVQYARHLEVLGAVCRDLAHPVASFFKAALRDEGLTEAQALALAGTLMDILLNPKDRVALRNALFEQREGDTE